MSPESVLQFLRNNPGFFEDHAATIALINIPHPEHGRAISLNERQLLSLRDRCRLLEAQLAELIAAGHANDERGERMHRLVLRLLSAPAGQRVEAVISGLREDFDIPWVFLSDGGAAQKALADQPGAVSTPGCGPVVGPQAERLSELAGQTVTSLAWVPLDTARGPRLLLLGSSDPARFPADAGMQYLQRIGDMLKVLLDGDG